jgi:nitroreductase
LEAVLQAGFLAPTGGNRQPQRVVVCQSAEALEKVRACTNSHYGAPVVLIVAYDRDEAAVNFLDTQRSTGADDACIALTHMMLESYNQGLASVWVALLKDAELHEAFAIPESWEIVALLPLGYAAEDAAPAGMHYATKEFEELFFFDEVG